MRIKSILTIARVLETFPAAVNKIEHDIKEGDVLEAVEVGVKAVCDGADRVFGSNFDVRIGATTLPLEICLNAVQDAVTTVVEDLRKGITPPKRDASKF